MSRITLDKSSLKYQGFNNSRQTNPIIYGYFPHKTYNEIAIAKVNKTLGVLLLGLIFVSLVSYYFVTASEMQLNMTGKETIKLNNENVELQNRLDNLQSYNNVDQIVRRENLLNTAKQVMEVPAATAGVVKSSRVNYKNAIDSFKWSVGY